jgi:hypothetical protein
MNGMLACLFIVNNHAKDSFVDKKDVVRNYIRMAKGLMSLKIFYKAVLEKIPKLFFRDGNHLLNDLTDLLHVNCQIKQ